MSTPGQAPLLPHIQSLDGFRGLAVLGVIAFHTRDFAGMSAPPSNALDPLVFGALGLGWAGVDLFFVLSGFLITGILIDAKGQPDYFRNFYARRALRIMPLYYAVLLAWLLWPLAFPSTPVPSAGKAAAAALFLTNFHQVAQGGPSDLVLSPTWSLCVEEQFYLVWPLVVVALSPRWIFRVAMAVILLAPTFRIGVVLLDLPPWAAYVLPFGRMDALAVGGALAVLARSPGGLARRVRAARWTALVAGAALLVVLLVGGTASPHSALMVTAGLSAVALLGGALLVVAGAGGGAWQKFCELRVLRTAGKYSYAAYLFHYPIGWVVGYIALVRSRTFAPLRQLLEPIGSDLPLYALALVLIVVTTFAAARLSWLVLEGPALGLKRFFPTSGPARVGVGGERSMIEPARK